MKKKTRKILFIVKGVFVTLVSFIVITYFFSKEPFGVQPMKSNCVGIKVNSNIGYKIFPKGELGFEEPFDFIYSVQENSIKSDFEFCVGRNTQ